MAFSKRSGFGGGGRNTGRPSFNSFNRRDDSDRPELHDAVCSQCGRDCKVPFRPNGSKPVFCSDCFEKNGGGNSDRAPKRFDRDNSRGDFRSDSRSFTPRPSNNSGNSEELLAIGRKLDKIIELLSPKKETKEAKKVEVTKKS